MIAQHLCLYRVLAARFCCSRRDLSCRVSPARSSRNTVPRSVGQLTIIASWGDPARTVRCGAHGVLYCGVVTAHHRARSLLACSFPWASLCLYNNNKKKGNVWMRDVF